MQTVELLVSTSGNAAKMPKINKVFHDSLNFDFFHLIWKKVLKNVLLVSLQLVEVSCKNLNGIPLHCIAFPPILDILSGFIGCTRRRRYGCALPSLKKREDKL